MIRLVALACGLLCGAGLALSGLHDPSLLRAALAPQAAWSPILGVGLMTAALVAVLVGASAGRRSTPLLGGEMTPIPAAAGWRPLTGALLFGLGWGLAGYFPLSAMVGAGSLSGGATIFLLSTLGGLIVVRLIATGGRSGASGRRWSG